MAQLSFGNYLVALQIKNKKMEALE